MAANILNYLEMSEKDTHLRFNGILVFQMLIVSCIQYMRENESLFSGILMFSGATYVTLLTLLPKNHNIACCCLLSMFPFIGFEILINLIS